MICMTKYYIIIIKSLEIQEINVSKITAMTKYTWTYNYIF